MPLPTHWTDSLELTEAASISTCQLLLPLVQQLLHLAAPGYKTILNKRESSPAELKTHDSIISQYQ